MRKKVGAVVRGSSLLVGAPIKILQVLQLPLLESLPVSAKKKLGLAIGTTLF
jgi:hypothetical protein